MPAGRGAAVDHATVYRRVRRYAPEIEARLRRIRRASPLRREWRVDETYVKVRRRRAYLQRAVDEEGRTLDFHLSPTRSAKAAERFLGKALRACEAWETPVTLTTDEASAYPVAVAEPKREGGCPPAGGGAPPGQVPRQRDRGRPRAAEPADQADARVQADADRLRHDQGFRGDARAEEGPGRPALGAGRDQGRGAPGRARLRHRPGRPDRSRRPAPGTGPHGVNPSPPVRPRRAPAPDFATEPDRVQAHLDPFIPGERRPTTGVL